MFVCPGCDKKSQMRVSIGHPRTNFPLEMCTACFDSVAAQSPILGFIVEQMSDAFFPVETEVESGPPPPEVVPAPPTEEQIQEHMEQMGAWTIDPENPDAEEPVLTGTNGAVDDASTPGSQDARSDLVEENN